MSLPRMLKNMTLFLDGVNLRGEVAEVTLPKLSRKFEGYRGGGMNGEVDTDHGMEKLELQWKCGGLMEQVFKQFAAGTHNGVMMRFAGAYKRDDSTAVDSVQIVVRGRHKEIEPGTAKPGDKGDFSISSSLSYYKLTINNVDIIEIDILNMIEKVNGVDVLAAHRRALTM